MNFDRVRTQSPVDGAEARFVHDTASRVIASEARALQFADTETFAVPERGTR